MGMLHTIQSCYSPIKVSDITGIIAQSDQTQLIDGETDGYTYDSSDKPAKDILKLGPEANAIEAFFLGKDVTQGAGFGVHVWGWAAGGGPAELLAEISGTMGTARVGDSTVNCYASTLTVTSTHIKTAAAADSGNNRICKFAVDVAGLPDIFFEFYDISTVGAECISGAINGYWRYF